jgi:phage terminase large subunit-like protein
MRAALGRRDLFYLLTRLMGRADMDRDWLFERCREVQAAPDGHLDLWAREHYKSTIITFGQTVRDILNDPEITVGIFSHSRPVAKDFLGQIKHEFEHNDLLKRLYPDVLWAAPRRQAPVWSLDKGIVVRRRGNPKEATVEAWGLVDGQPTGKHFRLLVYDDVVTRESVTTPEMIAKVTECWALSLNLGASGAASGMTNGNGGGNSGGETGEKNGAKARADDADPSDNALVPAPTDAGNAPSASGAGRRRYIGTRYHFNDTWRTILERGAATPRIHPATATGAPDGTPVLLSTAALAEKRRQMGPYVFGCQMLLNPAADTAQGFRAEWLRRYASAASNGASHAGPHISADRASPLARWGHCNRYLLVDPAGERKKGSDYTVMLVVGLAPDGNRYLLDGVRDRLNLTGRAAALFRLHRTWRPLATGYEKYGMQADIEHVRTEQERRNYRFDITPLGGPMPKKDRIRRLVPEFEQGRMLLPHRLPFMDAEGKRRDLAREFVDEEYLAFPVSRHDDMLDCLARILDPDLGAEFPDPDSGGSGHAGYGADFGGHGRAGDTGDTGNMEYPLYG